MEGCGRGLWQWLLFLHRCLNAESAEAAENGKDRGTANNMLCEPLAEIALPLLLHPPSAVSALSALKNTA